MLGTLWRRLRFIGRRDRFAQDLQDEMRLHAELRAEKLRNSGLDPRQAEIQAHRRFGNRALHAEDSYREWTWAWLESLFQDCRYALRTIRRAPLFACGIAATIGLAIGVMCCSFSVFNAYLLRPFPVRDPYSLYQFRWNTQGAGWQTFSLPDVLALQKENRVFSEVIASAQAFAFLNGRPSTGRLVTGNYFSALGVQPAAGRTILPEDAAAPGSRPVVVLSHRIWQSRFSGDPAILGRNVTMRGSSFQVVGVMNPEFTGVEDSSFKDYGPDFWVPLSMCRQFSSDDLLGLAGRGTLTVIGRLQSGLGKTAARAGLESYARALTAGLPEAETPFRFTLESRATPIPLTPQVAAGFAAILAVFGLILLIACANVANMMLARALVRQREIAVRLSLGAGQSRLIRQLLTEALIFSVPGAVVGFFIASLGARVGPRLFLSAIHAPTFATMVRLAALDPDWRVFAFACATATVSAVLFGLAPALHATRSNLTAVSRGGFTGDPRPGRMRNRLVVLQVTLCILFLVTAGVLLRGTGRLANRDTGMELKKVVYATGSYTGKSNPQITPEDRRRFSERLAAQPWVEAISAAARPPLGLGVPVASLVPSASGNRVEAAYNNVSPEYFNVFRIPLRRGRTFTRQESLAGDAVVIVSESAASQLWPNEDPVGRSVVLQTGGTRGRPAIVIGVAANAISGWIYDQLDAPCVYLPLGALSAAPGFLIRVKGDAEMARRRFAAAVEETLPGSAWRFVPMEELANTTMMPLRTTSVISWILGAVALLLTLSGMYSLMSYLVSQRTQEIGVRMALGATRAAITRTVFAQALRLVASGVLVGTLLALALSRLLASAMDVVNTLDPVAYIGGIAPVVLAALAAAFFPARRAASISPSQTLRAD